ncbi:hypothetical protein D3C85_1021130 [compost metagenome]
MPLGFGARVSTVTPLVSPTLFRVRVMLLPAASRRVPPLAARPVTAMPLASLSPGCTVYWNTRELVPEPAR